MLKKKKKSFVCACVVGGWRGSVFLKVPVSGALENFHANPIRLVESARCLQPLKKDA